MDLPHINSTALISNDPKIIEQVQRAFQMNELVDVIATKDEADMLSIELPELIIIDFTNWELAFTVLDRIIEDPWLHYQNIITICSSYEVAHRIEGHRAISLIGAVSRYDLDKDLPVLLDLIRRNRQLLFHRGYETVVSDQISGRYTISNSLHEIEALINLICSYLFNTNRINVSRRNRLKVALTELLVNALEHGNCGIGFEEKQEWLESGKKITELIKQKLTLPENATKVIAFNYEINRDYSDFYIEDQGEGFDWKTYMNPDSEVLYTTVSGRGVIMARSSTARLEYNEKGNRVRCSIDHQEPVSNSFPAVLNHLVPEDVTEGMTILRQGDRSTYLYFIIKGRFMVTVDDKPMSILTPDDIFMGEMSFLLNGRRSATITALSSGQLIKISKKEFIGVIRKYPYYTLYLARLLARRVNQLNG